VAPDRLLLATGNHKKLKELREILTPVRISVVAPAEIGYDPQVDETGETFEANAILKADAGLAATGLWTLADDSGIEARALGWRPGVYSARYAGEPCDDEANNRKLIAELAGQADKYVRYRCVIALARPGCPPLTWSGACAGEHTATRSGGGGFGYDPYVLIPELGRTMAELTAEEKHARSHRGQALRGFVAWLQQESGRPEARTSGGPGGLAH
jgi:XTP/dITP diphosphohydrolase